MCLNIMHRMYVLKSEKTGKYYIGCTNDLKKRIVQHNKGETESTKRDMPWKIVCYKNFNDQKQAYECEKLVKSYKGGNGFRKIINGDVSE